MSKNIKTFGYVVIVLLLIAFAAWAFIGTAGSDHYSYQGYVLDVRESGKDTVITTISGDTQSEFTVKWYTRKTFNGGKTAIEAGDHIKLSTTPGSDTNIKRFSVYTGYVMEGKVVYVNEVDGPFILSFNKSINSLQLYSLILSDGEIKPMETGHEIKVRYQYPLSIGNKTVVVDTIEQVSDIPVPLTEQEKNRIAAHEYTLKD